MPEPNNAEIGFEKEIWKAADLLCGMLPKEYIYQTGKVGYSKKNIRIFGDVYELFEAK
jgi:hypothetical protein